MERQTADEQHDTGVYSPDLQAFIDEAPWERASIVRFVAEAAASLPAGARVIDIGAGAAPYRELFAHTDYVTSDWEQSLHAGAEALDVVASADALPTPDGAFDAVVCTQVLEHVAEPAVVLAEIFRVLDDDGQLFLTAPLAWEEHEMPHDYFRYTRSGLDHLLTDVGFGAIEITARTDCFTTLGQLIRSAKWSLGDASDETAEIRLAAFDRLEVLSDEVAALAPLDARRSFPLGYTVAARRPARRAAERGQTSAASLQVETPATAHRVPVLYLAPWVDLGGSDKGTIDWFKSIDRERWAPSLMTTQPSPNRWVPPLEEFAEEVWTLPELLPGEQFAEFVLGFIESRGVEVVHIMNSRFAFDLLPDLSALANPPVVVVQLHAEEPDRSGYVRYSSTRYGNLIDAFSVTSQQLADAMLDFEVPRSKLHVITTGVDATGEFDPEAIEPFTDLEGTAPRVLWPGRLVDQKDPMLTLDVVKLLVDRDVSFVLDVVGDGELETAVRERARELGVDQHICWYPPSHAMPRWYRSSDLLLMTSVFEGVPYVMYEALAMGVPVVVPALAGNVELLDHPESGGVLIDPRDDAVAYADAVQALLEDPERRLELGRQARARMLRDFSLSEMGANHDRLYDQLLAKRSAARPSAGRSARTVAPVTPAIEPLPAVTFPRDPGAPAEHSVAVIVPCYRHGRFIDDAIASIHAQTLTAAQIIVVDDASPDDETAEALNRLDRDPLVTVIRLAKNGGPSVARNRALAEVRANYVLPLDADDMLLPQALRDMVEQLEQAPADIGFVYPNAQHFGNRHDYYAAPSYNLHLLMQNNYCPATTLFDQRVFEAGIRYPEEMVFGHEDWDLVLQMAAHQIHGEPAQGPTFLYRKNGFSRINAVEFGGESSRKRIEDRHPTLYSDRARIKAEWAPALSLILLDGSATADGSWDDGLADDLRRQSCRDFEVIRTTPIAGKLDGLYVRAAEGDGVEQLADAVQRARGRFVVVLGESARERLRGRAFVEQIIRAFWGNVLLPHFALTTPAGVSTAPMTQLEARQVVDAEPIAVAWRRDPEDRTDPVEVFGRDSALADIVRSWESTAPLQWRAA